MYSDKPKIVLSYNDWKANGKWLCHNDFYITGQGNTPTEAYNNWAAKMDTISYIPRAGVWNKTSVNTWYSMGCPPYRSYLGNKRFIGYIPSTDELVLQG